ncbi:MAG: NAD(P)H-hydrate epimerase [Candidatus Nitrosocaldus sp.]|nr:NAD(P)H-hydrate epimerase [Candidatus Nitrosocaldus sp.]MCS7142116.1 NAD(P)H-hydrate epimerase [Candidatus Nitrosocaldus sp.]MDW8000007.1 NAD(P)H-hydrate epimerase [Candidatus Nitrosocaldus sp.]MDW8275736.1 NAD(P)H-hydrate epimerase [Candidatus Nitrosocaldus sp.]
MDAIIITTHDMMRIEERAHAMGVTRLLMMENAGAGIAHHIASKFSDLRGRRVVAIAGLGNNGGDAMVSARHLTYYRADVTVVLLGRGADIRTVEARTNWGILERMGGSIRLVELGEGMAMDSIRGMITNADVIVDGIFGTGIKGSIREPHASMIDAINASRAYKVAVDVPSGLDPDTGMYERCVRADATVTFHRAKRGLMVSRDVCGTIVVWPIGIPPEAEV